MESVHQNSLDAFRIPFHRHPSCGRNATAWGNLGVAAAAVLLEGEYSNRTRLNRQWL